VLDLTVKPSEFNYSTDEQIRRKEIKEDITIRLWNFWYLTNCGN
jgi:hypothetical protein